MKIPLTNYEINKVLNVVSSPHMPLCNKCVKWRGQIITELRNGNFGTMGKNFMHLVNHLQRDDHGNER